MLWFVRNTYVFCLQFLAHRSQNPWNLLNDRRIRTSFVLVFALWSSVPEVTWEPLRWNGCLIHNKPLFTTPVVAVQSLSLVRPFVSTRTAARQVPLPCIISQSLLKLMSTELVMSSNHPILCRPLLLPPSIFLSIGVFSSESALCIRWPEYWSFSFSISPSNEYSGLIKVKWVHYS